MVKSSLIMTKTNVINKRLRLSFLRFRSFWGLPTLPRPQSFKKWPITRFSSNFFKTNVQIFNVFSVFWIFFSCWRFFAVRPQNVIENGFLTWAYLLLVFCVFQKMYLILRILKFDILRVPPIQISTKKGWNLSFVKEISP
jgi:hypothetical protein